MKSAASHICLKMRCRTGLGAIANTEHTARPAPFMRPQNITSQPFGQMPDGRPVSLFTLAAGGGLRVTITNYGGAIVSLLAPDRAGTPADVVLGYDKLESYLKGRSHFGALCGRFANRIARARFTLDGTEYTLPANDGVHHLHGGPQGYDKLLWDADIVGGESEPALKLSRLSVDGEQGYPGNLHVEVTYSIEGANALRIHYRAGCDRPTPVNLTNHSYFNLAGHDAGEIGDHELQLFTTRFTPVDETLIPTGVLANVEATPLDFRRPARIGDRIAADDEQMRRAQGYDHNFVLEPANGRPVPAATVYEPRSGRVLEVLTTEPGVQFYSGNFLNGADVGKGGAVYQRRHGFCLETQHFPDSPNQPAFPSCILRPAEVFESTTIYRFSAR
jgi:aldose 1-epimerase